MSQINVDTIRSREGIAPSLDKGVIVTGVATATEGYFSGNVTIGGTLTYEDVTNQDVIGLITARSGIKIGNDQDSTGIGITLGTGAIGDASFAGIVTAATCIKVGDGSWGVGIGATILGNGNAVFSGITTSSSFVGDITGDITGNASSATALQTGREIGGVIFDGTGNINLPGVNAAGNQNTTGTAASVTDAAQSSITSLGTLTGLTVSGNILMTGTGAIDVAAGTTAQRPGSASAGMFRFNSTSSEFEGYNGSAWGDIGGGGVILIDGGNFDNGSSTVSTSNVFDGGDFGS